jgi:hypothetical protein
MRLELAPRDRLRQRVISRYVSALTSSPLSICDYLAGQFLIVTRHLPLSTRYAIGERLRDLADTVEQVNNDKRDKKHAERE